MSYFFLFLLYFISILYEIFFFTTKGMLVYNLVQVGTYMYFLFIPRMPTTVTHVLCCLFC